MDKSILLQKQVRDNSEDLRTYLQDLGQWEEDMKRKESELNGRGDEQAVPIPRNKAKKIEEIKGRKKDKDSDKEKPKKIKSYDYAAWDKFDVDAECQKVDKAEEETAESEEEDPSEEHKTRLRDEANYEKERGNQFVKNKKWDEAIACYTHSIACYSKDPIYFANRALCFLKKDDLHSAEADCTSALQLDPTYVKALQRRAAAREGLKQLPEAAEDLRRVLEVEPHNKESKQLLEKIEKRIGIVKEIKKYDSPKPSTSKIEIKEKIAPVSIKKEVKLENNKIKETEKEKLKVEVPKKIPWPERPSSEIILPIQKLPHQRSKKPLKRVEILLSNSSEVQLDSKKESDAKNIESTSLNIDYNETNALAKILAQTNQLNVDKILENIKKDVTNDKIDSPKETFEKTGAKSNKTELPVQTTEKTIEQEIVEESTANYDFPVPKTSVQFYSNWKTMKNNKKSKFNYLKKINPSEIPNIFKDSLESDLLSDIILILSENFVENMLPVYEFLNYLSGVKRFSALTMFMSMTDKIGLQKLFEYCENSCEASKENLDLLRRKYELY